MEDCAYVIPRARCGFLFAGMTVLIEQVEQDCPNRSSHLTSSHAAQSSSAFARQDTYDTRGCSVCITK